MFVVLFAKGIKNKFNTNTNEKTEKTVGFGDFDGNGITDVYA